MSMTSLITPPTNTQEIGKHKGSVSPRRGGGSEKEHPTLVRYLTYLYIAWNRQPTSGAPATDRADPLT